MTALFMKKRLTELCKPFQGGEDGIRTHDLLHAMQKELQNMYFGYF